MWEKADWVSLMEHGDDVGKSDYRVTVGWRIVS
jgi:hypothetical protein